MSGRAGRRGLDEFGNLEDLQNRQTQDWIFHLAGKLGMNKNPTFRVLIKFLIRFRSNLIKPCTQNAIP